jgi:hypothetical protein
MSDNFRYRRGDTKPILMVPDSAAPIHVGDLLFQDPTTKKARTAAAMLNQGSQTLNQQTLHDLFAGVALQRGGALEPGEVSFNLNPLPGQIVVATAGEFEFDCAATAFQPGDLVGGCNNAANTALAPQQVAKVTALANSIGVAVPEAAAIGQSCTSVVVRIASTILGGGQQAAVPGSSSGAV